MKRTVNLAHISRAMSLLSLVFFAGVASTQAAVFPRVCVETTYQTGIAALSADAAVNTTSISVNRPVPPFVALIINPGGANEERVPSVNVTVSGSNPYTLKLDTGMHYALNTASSGTYHLAFAHTAGETISFAGYSGFAYFGYNNTGNATVTIPRGISTFNFFTPGPTSYTGQPNTFLPGIHDNVFSAPFGGQADTTLTWILSTGQAVAANPGQGCGRITYQGRLTDTNAAANGAYDLQFTAFDTLTEGTAQSGTVLVEDAQVTNGIFTVQLNFGASFTNNKNARFLEIGVRAGVSTGGFTTLTPRQPLTSVPFAVNATNAFNVRLPIVNAAPIAIDCNEASEYGQMKVDTAANKLYVCTTTGWKSTVLQ